MAKLRLLVSRVGPAGSQNRDDIIDVSGDEAKRMIAAGQAIPFQSEKREKQVKRVKGAEKRA